MRLQGRGDVWYLALTISNYVTSVVRAPYVLYGVKYIDLVSLGKKGGYLALTKSYTAPPFFQNGLQAKSGFEMCFRPSTLCDLGCWGQNTSPYAQGCDLS